MYTSQPQLFLQFQRQIALHAVKLCIRYLQHLPYKYNIYNFVIKENCSSLHDLCDSVLDFIHS